MSRPWMPLYIADYRNKTAHLTAAEHGAYLLLIMHYWVNGGLPADENQLQRISAMTTAEWKKSCGTLRRFFHDGWKHERVDNEITKATELSNKRRTSVMQRYNKTPTIEPTNVEQLNTHARVVVSSFPEDPLSEVKEVSEEKACGRRKRKTALPSNFQPDREVARRLGWPEHRIDQQIQAFFDYSMAHAKLYADWPAAWRKWVNSPYQQQNGNGNGRSGSVLDAFDRLEQQLTGSDDNPPSEGGIFRLPAG